MKKIDKTVLNETAYISVFVLILSCLMHAAFLIFGKWDISVLWGNLLCGAAAIANFFLMGITVQKAVNSEEKNAKNIMKISQSLRTILLFAAAAAVVMIDGCNTLSGILSLFFPRIAAGFRPVLIKRRQAESEKSYNPKGERESEK